MASHMNLEKRFVLVNGNTGVDAGLNRGPTREAISELAHQIYQEEGCPSARADDHWFAAEGFLRREMFTRD